MTRSCILAAIACIVWIAVISDVAQSNPIVIIAVDLDCDTRCRMTQHAYLCDDTTYYHYSETTCTYCRGNGSQSCYSGGSVVGHECVNTIIQITRSERPESPHCNCNPPGIFYDAAEPSPKSPSGTTVNVFRLICQAP